MAQRPERAPRLDPFPGGVPRSVWLLGLIPAGLYGFAIDGLPGATAAVLLGLLAWAMVCHVRVRERRFRPDDAAEAQRAAERGLFDQLRTAPCELCGCATLLERCLDCSERHPQPGRRHLDEPEDPLR